MSPRDEWQDLTMSAGSNQDSTKERSQMVAQWSSCNPGVVSESYTRAASRQQASLTVPLPVLANPIK
jgi:hypothetical protein